MSRRLLVLLLLVAVVAGLAAWRLSGGVDDPDALENHGIKGPAEATRLPVAPAREQPSAHAGGGRTALALYVRDPSASWLGLLHGLRSAGVPVRVLTDANQALRHRVVLAYPSLTGANTPPGLRDALERHVREGGTLIGFSVVGGGLRDVFGFGESEETRGLRGLELTAANLGFWRAFPAERRVTLADHDEGDGIPGVRYRQTTHPPLATYDDGGAAITGGPFGRGHAYAVGFDLGHFILRAQGGRFNVPDDAYINSHQPKIDGLLRLLAALYVRGEPDAVLLRTAPHGRDFAALITHDVDYTGSMDNVDAYVRDEVARGIPATYFIQAKYVTDYNDHKFFDITRRAQLQDLAGRGMEIGSHSVAHSDMFREMPLGTGTERYPEYQPFVKTFTSVTGGSILGELRVSKFLLESLSGATVTAFRPGHLSLPPALPEALVATGYRYSSSIAAGQARTHLPYRMMHGRSYDASVPVYEFPVTIEDERWKLGENIDSAIALARAVGRGGGVVNVLIHTDALGGKLAFEQAFHAALRKEAWFGTVSGLGDWWSARDRVQVDVERGKDGRRHVEVFAPAAIDGLTLEVPAGWALEEPREGTPPALQRGTRVVLGPLRDGGRVRLSFLATR